MPNTVSDAGKKNCGPNDTHTEFTPKEQRQRDNASDGHSTEVRVLPLTKEQVESLSAENQGRYKAMVPGRVLGISTSRAADLITAGLVEALG